MRETSVHNVSILDLEKLKNLTSDYLKQKGKITDLQKLETITYGIVEKDDKHYLITTEGIGSGIALEDEEGEICWYISTYNERGEPVSHDCGPSLVTSYKYYDLLNWVTVKNVITLDKFIRNYNARLDENFESWNSFLSGELVLE